ncbi:hypothetical protein KPL40_19605 [Clostridium gasigenes]|uniref:hypothetical protein n=1 Tax=Clostridium gasigenes TaxID=94869 RepID=UPI001C0AFC4A|nr:hypothetical protein [Clostridium gasigenes]MBU3134611.1 hypothetical protein [Clostridium gasigenes]
MDLISFGLIFGTGILMFEALNKIRIIKDITLRKWNKLIKILDIEGYKILEKKQIEIGYILIIEIPIGGLTMKLEEYREQIEKTFIGKVTIKDIAFSNKASIEIITKEIKDIKYKFVKLEPTEVLLGFNNKGNPIIANMKKTPHIGVVGLSNSGKSKCVEIALQNLKDVNIVLLNAFSEDFKYIKCLRIVAENEILIYLKNLLECKIYKDKPLYIVIDELNILSNNKEINKIIGELLKVARHYNIYLICLAQDMLKETVKFKNLFNTRICFKAIEESSYRAFLGYSVEEKELEQREFYCLSNGLIKGKTYNIK